MEAIERGSPSRLEASLRARPDVAVILLWVIAAAALAFTRQDFWGDGMRHLPRLLSNPAPSLGEPRWLLFPPLLFLFLRPLVLVGLVHDAQGLERAFSVVSLTCMLTYLLLLRRLLMVRGVTAWTRAAAIALAASIEPMLRMGSDNLEPTFAVPVAVAGLVYLAVHADDDARAPRALVVATAAIAVAALIYQGMALATAFVPMVISRERLQKFLRRPAVLVVAALPLAAFPLVTLGALCAQGHPLDEGIFLLFKATRNPLAMSFPSPNVVTPSKIFVGMVFGPSVNIAGPLNWLGVHHFFSQLRAPATRLAALVDFGSIGVGAALLATVLIAAFRRRDWTVLLAMGAILLLPVVRSNQNTYVKFYVLLPVILAVGATYLRPRIAWALAAGLLVVNGVRFASEIARGRETFAAYSRFYATLPAGACFVTSGWGAPMTQIYPGTNCPGLGTLGVNDAGLGMTPAQILRTNQQSFAACLQRCYCESSEVLTDDMTLEKSGQVHAVTDHFEFTDVDIDPLLLTPADSVTTPDQPPTMHAYSRVAQERACAQVKGSLSSR